MIEIKIAPREKVLFLAPGNVFLETKIDCYELNLAGAVAPNWADVTVNGDELVNYQCVIHKKPVLLSDSSLTEANSRDVKLTLYINNIFVNPEIKHLFRKINAKTLVS